MSKTASKTAMEELHAQLAKALETALKTDPSASIMAVAAKFLKDNGIEVAPGVSNSQLDDLAETLEEELPFGAEHQAH